MAYDGAEYDNFASESIDDVLAPCNICGRTFLPETLVKHERICAKNVNSKSRKVFQSGKQRAQGSDVPLAKTLKSDSAPPPKERSAKKNNWREKHTDFINTIRAARGVQQAINSGAPLPPPPPPTINPDYVQCPTCSRRFSEKAAERHIPFCAEKNKRMPEKKTADPAAQRRMDARLNYKTAKPKFKGREESAYNQSNNSSAYTNGHGMEVNGYGSPMRTGKTEKNYNAGLALRSSSLDRRKGSGEKSRANIPRINSHDSVSRITSDSGPDPGRFYSPSPPGSGRPPSGSYQHRARDYGGANDPKSTRPSGSADYKNRKMNNNNQSHKRMSSASRFCHDCGFKYCRTEARYCCECGASRLII